MTMTRRMTSLLTGALASTATLISAGCLQASLNPLFLHEEAIVDDRLIGAWACGRETWTFTRAVDDDGKALQIYTVTIRMEDTTEELAAWLGRLDDTVFVTFTSQSGPVVRNTFHARHILPVYTFGRITVEPSRLRLAMLDTDWVEAAEEAGLLPIGMKRQEPHKDVLLTAPSSDLQRFAKAFADSDEAFGERLEFARPGSPGAAGDSPRSELPGCYSEK